jgi:hypothetical protein
MGRLVNQFKRDAERLSIKKDREDKEKAIRDAEEAEK